MEASPLYGLENIAPIVLYSLGNSTTSSFCKRQKAGTLKSKQSSDRIQKSNTEESNEKTEKSRRLVQNL